MVFVTSAEILPANQYQRFALDHDAAAHAELIALKKGHVAALASILQAHALQDILEIHLLHRHFDIQEGEGLIHWEISCEGPDAELIHVDVSHVMHCPDNAANYLHPIMWYSPREGELVPYEYAVRPASKVRAVEKVDAESLSKFAAVFCSAVWGMGLQRLVSLKDKSCLSGAEYVCPDERGLFRVPFSVVSLQPGSGMVETGWTMNDEKHTPISAHRPGPDHPFAAATDGHVTQTRQTTAGTVATYHKISRYGEFAFNPSEISPAYTDIMWGALFSAQVSGFESVVRNAVFV